jgi:tRNA 2-selenouridine synthase
MWLWSIWRVWLITVEAAFGGLGQPNQPSTEHYENGLAEALDGYAKRQAPQIWLEAESSSVGCCRIPKALFEQMQQAPGARNTPQSR